MTQTNDSSATGTAKELSNFVFDGLRLLRDIEYRPMHDRTDLEELYRFRYSCYRRRDYIATNAEKMSYDSLDDDPHVMRFGVYLEGRLVSSIRLQHLNEHKRLGLSMLTYPDVVEPMIEQGMSMIDPSRLTIDWEASREFPLLPFLTVRLAAIASIHFKVDYCLSTIRPSHGAFYRRVIESKEICGERAVEGMTFPVRLYASHVPSSRERVFGRYSFFHSLPHERRMLFGEWDAGKELPLTILPTAEQAIAA